MTSLRLFESSERWLYCLLFSAGTVLRPLHQAQRCQVPSAVRAGALPPSGGVPRAAGERQSATRRLRLQTDVPSLPAEVNITMSTSRKPVAVSSVSLPWDVFTQYKSSCNLSIVFLNNQWVEKGRHQKLDPVNFLYFIFYSIIKIVYNIKWLL